MRFRRRLALAAGAALLALALPGPASAHGLGGIRDLPVPGWLFLVGGATVLVVSFLALGALWREPRLHDGAGRPFSPGVQAVLRSPYLVGTLRALSFALFLLVWGAAAFGTDRASENITPTFVYVVFWVGIPVLSVLLGNVWAALDPWRTGADAVAWVGRRLGIRRQVRPYPGRLGLWPAMVLLASFTVLELVYWDPADPRVLAEAITLYSAATWAGALVFGREEWWRNGDGLSRYFGFLSRVALFGSRGRERGGRELIVRQPLSALTRVEARPGTVAFVAVMLGTVAFDGLSRSTWWLNRTYDIETRFSNPHTAERMVALANLAGMIVTVSLAATLYLLAVRAAEVISEGPHGLSGVFIGSLFPIAFVYALSHYFSLLVIQSQFLVPRLSDPFGRGWDLFGTLDFQPNLGVLTPNLTWYVQVAALVLGHVVGLIVAHDRAVAISPTPEIALRTQYVMLTLMVLYTVGGMYLLSIG